MTAVEPTQGAAAATGRFDSILDSVGHTPLVEIARLSPRPTVRLFAKLEMMNPTGSVKDRAAKYLVEDLERSGRLGPDSIILEPTSGNTGIALAMIARRKGYRIALVMPDNVTPERRDVARLFGAEIIDSPGAEGSNGAIRLARRMAAADPRYVMPDQYANPANPRAHYETTGPEILDACPEIDAFVAGLGTGGTLMGVGRYLRERKPAVKIYAAEPMPGENVQGLRSLDDGLRPGDLRSEHPRREVSSSRTATASPPSVSSSSSRGSSAGRRAARSIVAARRVGQALAASPAGGGTIVALLPDGGWKYLSAGTFSRDLDEMEADLEGGVHWW